MGTKDLSHRNLGLGSCTTAIAYTDLPSAMRRCQVPRSVKPSIAPRTVSDTHVERKYAGIRASVRNQLDWLIWRQLGSELRSGETTAAAVAQNINIFKKYYV